MRSARNWPTRLESGVRTRPHIARESHHNCDAGDASSELRFGVGWRKVSDGCSMKYARIVAIAILVTMAIACLLADFIAPSSYARQFRDIPDAAASRQHPLGTD